MKKYFKLFSLLFIFGFCFFLGIKEANAVTSHEFFYDYEFNVKMPTTLQNGVNELVLSPVATNPNNQNVALENLTISYKITEISKEIYDEFKAIQDNIDAATTQLTSTDTNIVAYNNLINEKYVDNNYWCYDDYTVGKITLDTNYCGTKYYIVTVDALEEDVLIGGNFPWNYKVARVYEVSGSKTDCDTPPVENDDEIKEENPKTGLNNPYFLLGGIAIISTSAIIITKKKKFI